MIDRVTWGIFHCILDIMRHSYLAQNDIHTISILLVR